MTILCIENEAFQRREFVFTEATNIGVLKKDFLKVSQNSEKKTRAKVSGSFIPVKFEKSLRIPVYRTSETASVFTDLLLYFYLYSLKERRTLSNSYIAISNN